MNRVSSLALPVAIMISIGVLSSLCFSIVRGQDFYVGLSAYDAGDYAAALREWQPLAEQGDAEAQNNLGYMYKEGLGVPQDYREALQWYLLSAVQGNAQAQVNIGFMYNHGEGLPQNYSEAIHWYRLSAEQGNALAQLRLGFMYMLGFGVSRDRVLTHMWFSMAAANGEDDAADLRDRTARLMTAEAIAEAQHRALACMASGYRDCD